MKKLFFLSVLIASGSAYAQHAHINQSAAMPTSRTNTVRSKSNPRKDTTDGQDTISPCNHRFGAGLYAHDPKFSLSLRFTRRFFAEYRIGVENIFAGSEHPAPFNDLSLHGLYHCGHMLRISAGIGINAVMHDRSEESKKFEWYWNMIPVHAEIFPFIHRAPRLGFVLEAGAAMPIGHDAKPSGLFDGGVIYYFN